LKIIVLILLACFCIVPVNAAQTKLTCSKSNGMSVPIIIDNKKKTATYGYLDTIRYFRKGDYIYWINMTVSETLTDPLVFVFYLNTKTGVLKSDGNAGLKYTRNCFKSIDA